MHTESAVRALHEQQRQHREDVIHAASIRAMLCAARGLSESQACHPPGCAPSLLAAGVGSGEEGGGMTDPVLRHAGSNIPGRKVTGNHQFGPGTHTRHCVPGDHWIGIGVGWKKTGPLKLWTCPGCVARKAGVA